MRNILFYGDSNTWGFDPETCGRYDYGERWTTICAQALGEAYHCIPAGMNGRTTIFDDPWKGCRNGVRGLDYELQSHKPLDLCVVMLGTNDLKFTDAKGSAAGMERLLRKILTANQRYSLSSPVFPEAAKFLLVSPAFLNSNITEIGLHDAREESRKMAGLYEALAGKYSLEFLDASSVTGPSAADGVHLDAEGHRKLGLAIAEKIQTL